MQLARAIDAQVYKQSALILALNPIMAKYIIATRGVTSAKMRVVHDWVEAAGFPKNQSKNGRFRKKHGLSSDVFIAMYVGSMTRTAGLGLYLEAAERLRHRKDILIVLVGDGTLREEVEAAIRLKGLDNIKMIYPLKPEDVAEVQAAADVLVLSLLPCAAEHATPSKIVFYMFSERPILASVKYDSPSARLIQDSRCGYVIRQNDPLELASTLEKMANHRGCLDNFGKNARRYAEENFLKDSILPRVCDMIEEVGHQQ
jgi:colanic acid biosynthesis glycosyl transferase WcaI